MNPFQSEDRVAFFGDSLTHAGSYHRFIRNYYFTRYPGIDLKTFNCGNSGGGAQGGVFRMEFDLLNFKPNKVFILFGMNDVGRDSYGVENPGAANLADRKRALDVYAESMETIVRRLRDANVEEIVLLSPTPYEEEAEIPEFNLKGTLGALETCAQANERLAEKYGCATVDLLTPMLALNRKLREKDPAASLAGPDRVHPTTLGHAVMAYLILTAQQVPSNVFSASLGPVASVDNCAVTGMKSADDGFEFHLAPRAMPYPPFPESDAVDALVPFTRNLNRMPLSVHGLEAGTYAVEVDGALLAEVPAARLAEGIDLHLKSPKSEKIGELNLRYQQEEMKLRQIMKLEVDLRAARISLDDKSAIQAYMADFLEEVKDKPWFPYYENLFRTYFDLKSSEQDTMTAMRIISEELSVDIEPLGRTISLKRVAV